MTPDTEFDSVLSVLVKLRAKAAKCDSLSSELEDASRKIRALELKVRELLRDARIVANLTRGAVVERRAWDRTERMGSGWKP